MTSKIGFPWHRWVITWIVTLCITLLLAVGPLLQPSHAQLSVPPPPRADVVVDGQVLFRLGSIDGFTAEERANSANALLKQVLQSTPPTRPIIVRVVPREELITIRVSRRHLLTLTQGDSMQGVTSREQADEWAEILQQALERAQWEREPTYYRGIVGKAIAGLLAAIALHIFIYWMRRQLWRRWTKARYRSTYRWQLLAPASLGLKVLVWLAFAFYLSELFPWARTGRYQLLRFLGQAFTSGLITLGEQNYSLLDVARLILFTVALWLISRGLTATIKARFLQVAISDRGLQDAIATALQFSFMGLGLFILLQAWGIDLSALAILASVLGVGLGFGLQNIANNFISGWILLIERPVQVGDFINLGDLMGTVERVGARSTEIRTLDRVSIIVPNAELVQTKVVNWSHGHPVSRLHLSLGVAYGSSIRQVHRAAMEAAQSHPEVLRYPQPRLRFLGFGESSLDFDLMVWIRDPRHQFDIKSDVYYLLEASLRRYQIEIPFPQRDLNLRNPEVLSGWSAQPTQSPSSVPTPELPSSIPTHAADLLDDVISYSSILRDQRSVTERELERLVGQMRGPEGLAVSDRRFRLKVYSCCFVGSEAVTWIVQTQKATREAAVRLGQSLVEQGIIHHVTDEHAFKDENLFYRFYEDEK